MTTWNVLLQCLQFESTFGTADVVCRNEQVDAVGFASTLLRNPGERLSEFRRFEARGPEHAETASLAHGSNYSRTMAEGKERDVHTILFTESCVHDLPPGGCPP